MSTDQQIIKPPRGVVTVQGEDVVRVMRTHPKLLFWPIAGTLALLFVTILAWVFLPLDFYTVNLPWIATAAAFVLFLFVGFKPWYLWITSNYTLTSRQLVHTMGLFSRSAHSTRLERVSDISNHQGILDQLFGCGTLTLTNAAHFGQQAEGESLAGAQMVVHDVPNVKLVHQQIEELIHEIHNPSEARDEDRQPGADIPDTQPW